MFALKSLHLRACSTAASTCPGLLFQVPSPRRGIFIPLFRVREVAMLDVVTAKCERLSRECSQRYVRQNQYLPYVPYVQVEPFPYLSRSGLLRMY